MWTTTRVRNEHKPGLHSCSRWRTLAWETRTSPAGAEGWVSCSTSTSSLCLSVSFGCHRCVEREQAQPAYQFPLETVGLRNEHKSDLPDLSVRNEHKPGLPRQKQGRAQRAQICHDRRGVRVAQRAQIPLNHRAVEQQETTGNKNISSPHPTYQIPRQQIDAIMAG